MSTLEQYTPVVDLVIGDIKDEFLKDKTKILEFINKLSILLSNDDSKYNEACSVIDIHSTSKYYAVIFPFNLLVRQESRMMILLIEKEEKDTIPNIVELNQLLPRVKLHFKNKPTSDKEDIIKLGKWLLENFNS